MKTEAVLNCDIEPAALIRLCRMAGFELTAECVLATYRSHRLAEALRMALRCMWTGGAA